MATITYLRVIPGMSLPISFRIDSVSLYVCLSVFLSCARSFIDGLWFSMAINETLITTTFLLCSERQQGANGLQRRALYPTYRWCLFASKLERIAVWDRLFLLCSRVKCFFEQCLVPQFFLSNYVILVLLENRSWFYRWKNSSRKRIKFFFLKC